MSLHGSWNETGNKTEIPEDETLKICLIAVATDDIRGFFKHVEAISLKYFFARLTP